MGKGKRTVARRLGHRMLVSLARLKFEGRISELSLNMIMTTLMYLNIMVNAKYFEQILPFYPAS
jgi:hypothetical protein